MSRVALVGVTASQSTLTERLGRTPDARLVIISCDDLGAFQAANEGVYQSLRKGVATCASLMVPAPWARHAVLNYADDDIGVHLTLNSEHAMYRWGPITHAPSLQSGEGGFPRTIDDLWEHADSTEVFRECRAQIARAIEWGIDVTHLAPHLTAITLRPEFACRQVSAKNRLDSAFGNLLPKQAYHSPITSTTTGVRAAASACSLRSPRYNQESPKFMSNRALILPRSVPLARWLSVGSTTTN